MELSLVVNGPLGQVHQRSHPQAQVGVDEARPESRRGRRGPPWSPDQNTLANAPFGFRLDILPPAHLSRWFYYSGKFSSQRQIRAVSLAISLVASPI